MDLLTLWFSLGIHGADERTQIHSDFNRGRELKPASWPSPTTFILPHSEKAKNSGSTRQPRSNPSSVTYQLGNPVEMIQMPRLSFFSCKRMTSKMKQFATVFGTEKASLHPQPQLKLATFPRPDTGARNHGFPICADHCNV